MLSSTSSMTRATRARRRRRPSPARRPRLSDTWQYLAQSPPDTERLGRRLGRALKGGDVLALYGELGAGKTALVRGIAAGLGASPEGVSSPTFVLIHEYRGRLRLAHADLYRIESAVELAQLGLSDYDDGKTVTAIEWADRAGIDLPVARLEIYLQHHGPTSRKLRFVARGARAQRLLMQLTARQRAPGL
ncbi:MAG: tRNA (adenosine(37)-N6)-threonylcarbamoyltransferase complex ATPase subunit type 1 TsaE [Nitrospira sp.]